MQFLKADTTVIVRIGPAVDISDGFTCLATLDISTADYAYISENGGTETDISGNTWAAVASVTGWYDLTLTAAQLDTEGPLTVMIYDVSLCLPIFKEFMVVNANVYDSLFAAAATDYLQVDMIQAVSKAAQIIQGTCDGTPSATSITTTLESTHSLTTDDALIGRVIIFDGNTTAALKGQAAAITDYTGVSGTVTIAASAITTAPASGDTFTIV